jgi:hypothetical protein
MGPPALSTPGGSALAGGGTWGGGGVSHARAPPQADSSLPFKNFNLPEDTGGKMLARPGAQRARAGVLSPACTYTAPRARGHAAAPRCIRVHCAKA